jgi:hypothetical protein
MKRLAVLTLALVSGTLAAGTAAAATRPAYRVSLTTHRAVPGGSGLTVNMEQSLLVPGAWQARKAPAGHRRFLSPDARCPYLIDVWTTARLAPRTTASAQLDVILPEASARRVIDHGTRGIAAWRVTHPAASHVTLRAVRTRTLTLGTGVTVPAGQAVWLDLWATATPSGATECHSGSYRSRIGPQLGDMDAMVREMGFVSGG